MNARDIGSSIISRVGVRPADQAAGTVNGLAIDRGSSLSLVLHHYTGAVSGAPTAQTLASRLQSSADGSTGWADITGAAPADITAANADSEKNIDLSGVSNKFVRVVSTVSFTAGTTPKILIGAEIILGPPRSRPV